MSTPYPGMEGIEAAQKLLAIAVVFLQHFVLRTRDHASTPWQVPANAAWQGSIRWCRRLREHQDG